VTDNFIAWWREQVEDSLSSAEQAAMSLREELVRLGEAARLGECFHELTHIEDALADLRCDLGLTD
jgi:hypothetical protein